MQENSGWKPEDRRLVQRPKYKWKDNINISLKEMRCERVVLFRMAQDNVQWHALVNMVMYVGFQVLTVVITQNFIFLGHNTMESRESQPPFSRNMSPPSLGLKNTASKLCLQLLHIVFLRGLHFNLHGGSNIFFIMSAASHCQ
jgi:hypothetical protein